MTLRDYGAAVAGATILLGIATFVVFAATLLFVASGAQWLFTLPARIWR